MRDYVPKGWRCDPARWRMMVNYSRQYPRWKWEINDIKLEYRACGSSESGAASDTASTVERMVERIADLQDNIDRIEMCCRAAVGAKAHLYEALLTSVTTTTPLERINSPVGRKQLSRYRKQFFYTLNTELEKKGLV